MVDLNKLFRTESAASAALFEPVLDFVSTVLPLSPRQKEALDKVKRGVPLAGILGIDREQRDAMLLHGCQLFKAGRLEQAYDTLKTLYMLQPTDSRVVYALALTLQVGGAITQAADVFLIFIALDATNAEGHLRRAECLMSLRELEEAKGHLRAASRLAATPAQRSHADRLLAHIEDAMEGGTNAGSRAEAASEEQPSEDFAKEDLAENPE